MSNLLCKLVVENKQHKQLIDSAKPDDIHLSNSSFLLPFSLYGGILTNFSWATVNFSIFSSLKPAPGMSPGVRSTWSSSVLVIFNLPQGPFMPHFHATSVFFFLESEYYRISLVWWVPGIFAEESSPPRAKHVWRTVEFAVKLPDIRRSRQQRDRCRPLEGQKIIFCVCVPNHRQTFE